MPAQLLWIPNLKLSKWGTHEIRLRQVSSNTQDHAAQVEAPKAAGCERIFSEKASGRSTNGRPEFAKLMKALNHGDVVTVVLDVWLGRAATCRISCTNCRKSFAALSRSARLGAIPRPTSAGC